MRLQGVCALCIWHEKGFCIRHWSVVVGTDGHCARYAPTSPTPLKYVGANERGAVLPNRSVYQETVIVHRQIQLPKQKAMLAKNWHFSRHIFFPSTRCG